MSLTKYDSYKNSGVEWLGAVPKHWETTRVKAITSIISKGTTPSTEGFSFVDKGIRFIKAENISNKKEVFANPTYWINKEANNILSRSQLKEHDLLIVIAGATIGKVSIVDRNILPANTNQAVCFMRYIKSITDIDFMYYIFSSPFIKEYIWYSAVQSAQPNLSMGVLGNFILFIPPLQEQQQIAHYLDQQNNIIDKKISLLKTKTDHYKALKKSLINETVCRGLDKTVALKDSGIEWIGAIPEHWEIKRLKDLGFLYSGLSGKKGADFNQENNPNNRGFIPFTNIANNTYLDKNHLGVVEIKENENQNQIQKHDLFFLMSSEGYEDLGKSALLVDNVGEVYLNSFCKGFRLTDSGIHSYYLNYLLLSDSYRNTMMIEGKGFTRINLKMNKINDFIIAVPSLKEQQQIAKYLDEKTGIIDQIITNIKSQIERLKELRKSLINDVVTGKVRVPEMESVQ